VLTICTVVAGWTWKGPNRWIKVAVMKKILVPFIVSVAIGAGLWLMFLYSENSGKEKSVATKEEALRHDPMVIAKKPPGNSTGAMASGKDNTNAEQELKTAKPAVNLSVQDLIARIEDKKADSVKRQEYFILFKKQYPAVALQFARKRADEFSSTGRDLQMRMFNANRHGTPDKEAEGDYDIGAISANLVMETEVKEYHTPAEKVKYLIRTALSKGWTSGRPSLKPYCEDLDDNDKGDLAPGEEKMFLSSCEDSCDKDCLEKIWARHEADWSYAAISLKNKIIILKCKNYKICNVDAFLQRLSELDDPENDVYHHLIHFLVQWPRAHCIPFEDMMKRAEKTGNTRFIEALIRFEQKYRSKQSGYCK